MSASESNLEYFVFKAMENLKKDSVRVSLAVVGEISKHVFR